MEEKIEDLLNTHLLCPYTPFSLSCYQKAAAEIAKLVGAELAAKDIEIKRLRNICEIKDEVADELQQRYLSYEAQLAEMREALQHLRNEAHGITNAWPKEIAQATGWTNVICLQRAIEEADEALSAAPEVKNGRED